MKKDDLIPLKQVAGALGVSRPTLWRASKSVGKFPPPLVLHGRVYWRQADLPVLRAALARYQGRMAFEIEQRHAKVRAALAEAAAQGKKRSKRKPADDPRQPGLFG